ncbi:hypothetical protein KGM_213195 [Danaus plexippus plexippus]|uniref:Uncharacterized protein n=1 Tax=Danaus plexippus plexippus TaxID=278856 RepID=A0A212FAX8_DANPL|nr:hypothetical protein KGM_213195 [Danaus plexippus plexippus]
MARLPLRAPPLAASIAYRARWSATLTFSRVIADKHQTLTERGPLPARGDVANSSPQETLYNRGR